MQKNFADSFSVFVSAVHISRSRNVSAFGRSLTQTTQVESYMQIPDTCGLFDPQDTIEMMIILNEVLAKSLHVVFQSSALTSMSW